MDRIASRQPPRSPSSSTPAACGVALLLLAPGAALAAHPLVTDDTGTQGSRRFQVELMGELGSDTRRRGGVQIDERAAEVGAVFTGGLLDELDLVVGAPWAWSRVSQGGAVSESSSVGGATIELKWRFFQRDGFSLAVKPGFTFGGGNYGVGAALIASQELGRLTLHANFSYARNEYKLEQDRLANRADIFHGSLAATVKLRKRVQLVADVGLESNGDAASSDWPVFALGGLIYSLGDNLDLDVGVKVGLTDPEPDVSALAGLAWRF